MVRPRVVASVLPLVLILAAVLATPAGAAYGLKRYENSTWIWYQPRSWSTAQGENGIDISSPGGREYVSHGFAGSAFPVTNDEVMEYVRNNSNPSLSNFRTIRRSAARTVGEITRVTYDWSARRGDNRLAIRGFSQIDVFNGPYGFYYSGYLAPSSKWRSKKAMLKFMWKNTRYLPQGPTGGLDF